jgi:uncharacterized protein (DUF58 family)
MLTQRGRLVLALGPVLYIIAWGAGSKPLYPVAVGLVLAVGLAWIWVYLLRGPMQLRRRMRDGEHVEGSDVDVTLELVPLGRLTPSSLVVVERLARAGTVEVALEQRGPRLTGRYHLRGLARGRYTYETSHAVLEDPFGLARAEVQLASGGSVLVYPRIVALERLFTESGVDLQGGRRLLLRRQSGFDLHGVREYQQGESLRRVHWRSTAHRGRLMVKELEDEPRDEVAVLLDPAAETVVGTAPDSSFELQVRAAGSILSAHVRRARRAVLLVGGTAHGERRVDAGEADWRRALELLAAVEPERGLSPNAVVGDEGATAATRALELVIVTARLAPELVERVSRRAVAGRRVALVYVHAPSFASGNAAPVREPALLRLHALGVPVAVLRRGDDLRSALEGALFGEAAVG